MFELSSDNQDEIVVKTASKTIVFNMLESTIAADLPNGKIYGPGEYEIGEATIKGIGVSNNEKTVYDVEVGGVHIAIIGGVEEAFDEFEIADILCTSSVRAVREISPKVIIATGNVDGMVTELKLSARTEKKYKVKNADALPGTQEVVVLN